MREADLLKQVKDYLNAKQIMYIRLNSGAFKTEKGFYRMADSGISDLIIIKDERVLFVELKIPGNKQSGSQIIFEKRLKKAGGLYYVCHSLEELIKLL